MERQYDALVVGAGFSGLYLIYRLRNLGLSVLCIDEASDVGGTWYWNRYPGAMSDTEAYIYRFSWDDEDLKQYPWKEHYVKQPDALAYLEHVAKRHDLRKHMQFDTKLESAEFDEKQNRWRIETSNKGESISARYVITGLGLLSKVNFPDYKGIDSFKGEMYHTGKFPKDWDFSSKRVGVIGSGSTGVQVITALAGKTKQLVCFQRRPQYSVPSGDGPVSKEYRQKVNENYDNIWKQVKNSVVAFGFEESQVETMSVSAEERQRVFQENWDKGNGFRFMFGTFCDLTYNPEANEEACKFIRGKIKQIVKDPEKARKLCPDEPYARRPLCDGGYYEGFNNPNVDIVLLSETPIAEFTPDGIVTSDGKKHELDVIIFATGFDAVDGNYTRMMISGRNGKTIKDHWAERPTSYLGMCLPGFPNFFMITGPNGPFTNIPPGIEAQVEFITDAIGKINQDGKLMEAKQEAETEWVDLCTRLAEGTLFTKTPSWIFGANIPGKTVSITFYFGGLGAYRKRLIEEAENNYSGFKIQDPVAVS